MNKKVDDRNFLVLSDYKKRCVDLKNTVGQNLSRLSLTLQKELVLCHPQIILSFPKRSKELILTAVSVDYELVSDLDISEVDDEILTLAIESCNSFRNDMSYSIKAVFKKKKFSQPTEDLVMKYWLSDISGYSLNEMNLSQESLLNIISRRPKLFKDLAINCSFAVCERAILKSYDNVEHLPLCKNLTDIESLKLSRLALSRNENALNHISIVHAKTAIEALSLLDKKIKIYDMIEYKNGVSND